MTNLPKSFGNLKNLIELNMTSNNIAPIAPQIGDLKNLIDLHLGHCNFNVFPKFIKNLPKLIALDLSGNNISALPEWIGDLKYLSTLNLGWNRLSTLPDSFETLAALSNLTISDNLFTTLPRVLNKFNQIETISLIPNPFKSFESLKYFFLNPDYLNILDLLNIYGRDLPETIKQLVYNNNPEGLFNYYNISLTEIVENCISNSDSLSDHEIERLIWESSGAERDILEIYLANDHPILNHINKRLKFNLKNNIKLFR